MQWNYYLGSFHLLWRIQDFKAEDYEAATDSGVGRRPICLTGFNLQVATTKIEDKPGQSTCLQKAMQKSDPLQTEFVVVNQ
jgi:hypothetical protein